MGSRKRLLTQLEERIVRDAYGRGATSAEAAFLAGVCVSLIQSRLRDQIADLRRGRGHGGRRGKLIDPTPEEIAARRAECDARRRMLMGVKFYDPTDLS